MTELDRAQCGAGGRAAVEGSPSVHKLGAAQEREASPACPLGIRPTSVRREDEP